MIINKDISNLIYKRTSTRAFKDTGLNDIQLQKIKSYIDDYRNQEGIFSFVRFELMKNRGNSVFGIYGHITGAEYFVAVIAKDSKKSLLDAGFAFQKHMLFAEKIGLGTCWLAATSFDRSAAKLNIALEKDEIVAAISPIGEKAVERSSAEIEIRKQYDSNNRLEFDTLFIDAKTGGRITNEEIKQELNHVRLAPSAINNQPWRVIVEGDVTHFYVVRMSNRLLSYDYEMMDIGAALCNYSTATGKNRFLIKEPYFDIPYEYVISVE